MYPQIAVQVWSQSMKNNVLRQFLPRRKDTRCKRNRRSLRVELLCDRRLLAADMINGVSGCYDGMDTVGDSSMESGYEAPYSTTAEDDSEAGDEATAIQRDDGPEPEYSSFEFGQLEWEEDWTSKIEVRLIGKATIEAGEELEVDRRDFTPGGELKVIEHYVRDNEDAEWGKRSLSIESQRTTVAVGNGGSKSGETKIVGTLEEFGADASKRGHEITLSEKVGSDPAFEGLVINGELITEGIQDPRESKIDFEFKEWTGHKKDWNGNLSPARRLTISKSRKFATLGGKEFEHNHREYTQTMNISDLYQYKSFTKDQDFAFVVKAFQPIRRVIARDYTDYIAFTPDPANIPGVGVPRDLLMERFQYEKTLDVKTGDPKLEKGLIARHDGEGLGPRVSASAEINHEKGTARYNFEEIDDIKNFKANERKLYEKIENLLLTSESFGSGGEESLQLHEFQIIGKYFN